MHTIIALIRAKQGSEELVRRELLAVAKAVAAEEPQTTAYHVSRSVDDSQLFTTFERFADEAAMERHNASAAVAKFVEATRDALADKIVLHTGEELSALQR